MAISVNWANPSSVGAAMGAAGRGAYRLRQRQDDREDAKFLLGLQQQDERLAVETALRQQAADDANARFYSAQQADAQQRQAALDAQLLGRQMAGEYDLARDQQNFGQQLELQANAAELQGYQSVEQSAAEAMKQLRQAKLDPEGKRRLAEFENSFRQINAQKGRRLREGQYEDLLGQWFDEFENANIGQYEIKEPTPDELWQQQTRTGDDGTVYGLDRSGNWRKLQDAPWKPIPPEEIESNTHEYPDGTRIFINPRTGKETVIAPPKAEKPAEPKTMTPAERASVWRDARTDLREQWMIEYPETTTPDTVVDGKVTKPGTTVPPAKSFDDYFDEKWPAYVQRYNRAFGDPEEETLVPTPMTNEPMGGTMDAPAFAPPAVGGFSPVGFDPSTPLVTDDLVYRPDPNNPVTATPLPNYDPSQPGEVQELSQPAGDGTPESPINLGGMDMEAAAATVQSAAPGTVFIDPETGQRWVK